MRRSALTITLLGSSCLFLAASPAAAVSRGDLCSAPTLKTDKWHSTTEVGGMTLMLPPGFVARGMATGTNNADTHGYFSGTHRFIMIGSGSGPSNLTMGGAELLQTADCETVLGGRRVELTSYTWTGEDNRMSPSGQAGPQYMAVARFFATGAQREVYIAFKSNIQSDIGSNRQLFWTVAFPGFAGGATPPASQTVGASLVAAAPGAVAAAPSPAAPACVPKADPALPAASAVVDSALVQMLISGSGPIPKGHALMALNFDGTSLAGISVSQSDLPDPMQKQLATLVASNLKPHDAKSPSSFVLRIDTQDEGLHYTVQGVCAQ
jgi:hypothetical protein